MPQTPQKRSSNTPHDANKKPRTNDFQDVPDSGDIEFVKEVRDPTHCVVVKKENKEDPPQSIKRSSSSKSRESPQPSSSTVVPNYSDREGKPHYAKKVKKLPPPKMSIPPPLTPKPQRPNKPRFLLLGIILLIMWVNPMNDITSECVTKEMVNITRNATRIVIVASDVAPVITQNHTDEVEDDIGDFLDDLLEDTIQDIRPVKPLVEPETVLEEYLETIATEHIHTHLAYDHMCIKVFLCMLGLSVYFCVSGHPYNALMLFVLFTLMIKLGCFASPPKECDDRFKPLDLSVVNPLSWFF
jgi:hypothetical protein